MNLTDLRDELATRADDLGATPDLTTGVAGHVRTLKRRRAVAAGSVATLTAAAVAVGVLTSVGRPAPVVPAGPPSSAAPMIGTDGMPLRTVPDAPGDVAKDGLRYRARVGDDTIATGFIGDPGQAQFSLRWMPRTTHVSFGAECYLPGLSAAEARKYMVSVGLVGSTGFFGSQCSGGRPTERDLPAGGDIPGEPGQGWSELTVGRDARVRVQLVDATTRKPASVDGAQITGAVYELGEQQLITDTAGATVAALPRVLEHQGYRYTLKSLNSAPLRTWKDLTFGVPAGPSLLTWGSAGGNLTGSGAGDGSGMRLTGLRDGDQGAGWGSYSTQPVPADSTPRVTLSAVGTKPGHGSGFVAVYSLEP
ncbi:MAG: hypothetical protein JWP82_2966 [Humibacillus sp.]|nr:hypothetical protein [Humibacillus sp.]